MPLPFITELKRRHVFKVGVAYLAIAWLLAQVLQLVFDTFGTPAWVMKTVLAVLAAGFVLALLLAWVYELTPGGIRKDSGRSDTGSRTAANGRGLLYATLFALLFGGIIFFLTREQPPTELSPGIETLIARPSVIVLPFANISGDAANDYLAFGITDELISGLQRLGYFPVISRNAALAYDAGEVSAMDYAESHGASYLVEGSINAGTEGIRILANLSRARGDQVWAERYRLAGDQAEIFDVSDELVSKVAGAVLESEVKRVSRKDRPPRDAWEHYMKGLKVVLEYAPEDYAEARGHLDKAVEIAPEMAEAWWAIGELEELKYVTEPMAHDSGTAPLFGFIEYFRKAHELSPFHAAACGCLGYMLTAVGKGEEARVVFEQAIEAKPLSPDLRVDYALHLTWAGRYDEALENADLVLRLGPTTTDRAGVWTVRALVALAREQQQEALDAVSRVMFVRRDPFYTPAAIAILYVLGKHEEAAAEFASMQAEFPGMQPTNPVFYVTLKPIDDFLSARRERGLTGDPADVAEIYRILNQEIGGQAD